MTKLLSKHLGKFAGAGFTVLNVILGLENEINGVHVALDGFLGPRLRSLSLCADVFRKDTKYSAAEGNFILQCEI